MDTIKTLDATPFKHIVMSIGELPTSFVDSMSYYECIAWLMSYIRDNVIPACNNNAEAIEEIQEWIKTLDLQDEVNNKIDELVESGELQRILNSPATTTTIGGVIVKDGLEVDAEGNLSVKAGNGISISSEGVSEAPYEDYLPIEAKEYDFIDAETNTNTHINYSIIPNQYRPQIVMSDPSDPDVRKNASDFDYEYKPTLMTNLFAWNSDTGTAYGVLKIDGEVKIENNLDEGGYWKRPIIGIDDNGILHNIDGSTSADNVEYDNAFRAWYCLYNNGDTNPNLDNTVYEPRTFLAQNTEGDYLIGVCGGRKDDDTGMTFANIIKFVNTTIGFGAKLIYSLDGGGSSNFMYHGIRQNKLIARTDRPCPNWLVWGSVTAKHESLFKSQSVNNKKNIFLTHQNDGHMINKDDIVANYTINERVTINANSRMFQICPRIINFNINFTITGEGNLSAYSHIIEGLPYTFGNVYFPLLNVDTGDVKRGYIYQDSTTQTSQLRNRDGLAPGAYVANLTLVVDEMY